MIAAALLIAIMGAPGSHEATLRDAYLPTFVEHCRIAASFDVDSSNLSNLDLAYRNECYGYFSGVLDAVVAAGGTLKTRGRVFHICAPIRSTPERSIRHLLAIAYDKPELISGGDETALSMALRSLSDVYPCQATE